MAALLAASHRLERRPGDNARRKVKIAHAVMQSCGHVGEFGALLLAGLRSVELDTRARRAVDRSLEVAQPMCAVVCLGEASQMGTQS